MKIVADRMGIDIYEVIAAASTKPFGFTSYYPGPGLGGHCIPIDPFYLTWKAREYGVNTRFIELAGEVNTSMPYWVLGKITAALNEYNKSLKNSKVLILGIAYKKDVDDMRESPAVKLMELLEEKGAVIDYSDPYIPIFPRMEEVYFDLKSIELTPENIIRYDLLLLVTNHSKFDYTLIKKHAKLIVDTRGVYLDPHSNIVRA
jgi:UDP-N-acetyl-D-glucosamine dehydrogenase